MAASSPRPRTTRQRLLRRAADLLIVVGGIVLSYPLWSAAYTRAQESGLESSYAAAETAYAVSSSRESTTIERIRDPEVRLRYLAGLYADQVRVGDTLGRLKIPAIGVDRLVIEGTPGAAGLNQKSDEDLLRKGLVHYGTTPLPGGGQPFAVAGHRTTYGAPFYHLNELRRGDRVLVELPYGEFEYRVAKLTEVSPDDVSVLADRGYGLVLTTCTPLYSAVRRLVVWATLEDFRLKD
jgi:sortase A